MKRLRYRSKSPLNNTNNNKDLFWQLHTATTPSEIKTLVIDDNAFILKPHLWIELFTKCEELVRLHNRPLNIVFLQKNDIITIKNNVSTEKYLKQIEDILQSSLNNHHSNTFMSKRSDAVILLTNNSNLGFLTTYHFSSHLIATRQIQLPVCTYQKLLSRLHYISNHKSIYARNKRTSIILFIWFISYVLYLTPYWKILLEKNSLENQLYYNIISPENIY